MDSMDWTRVATAVVAVYGALLATYDHFVANRPRIKVTASRGVAGWSQTGEVSEPMLFLKAANVGPRAVTLQVPFFLLSGGKKLVLMRVQHQVTLPHELPPGKACEVMVEESHVLGELRGEGYRRNVKMVGVWPDEIGVWHKSRPFVLNLEE